MNRFARGARAARCLLAFLPLPAVALAARSETRTVTLEQAIELAAAHNPEGAGARAAAEAGWAEAGAARRATWPRLAWTSDLSVSDDPVRAFGSRLRQGIFTEDDFAVSRLNQPQAIGQLTSLLALEAPLDLFGKGDAVRGRAAALAEAGAAGADEVADEVRFRTERAYLDAVFARAAVRVGERAVATAAAREREISLTVDQGAALPADLLRARARWREREGDLARLEGDWLVARAALGRAIGAPAGVVHEPGEEMVVAPAPLAGDLEKWCERGLARRGLAAAASHAAAAALWSARGEERARLPDLVLYGQLEDDRGVPGRGGQSATAGAALGFAVFDPGRADRIAAARSRRLAALEAERAAVATVRLEVETAWRRAEVARRRLEAATGGAEEGRESLRVVRERRLAGMATLTDELETEVASLAAELEEARVAIEVRLADAALGRAAGGAGDEE